MDCAVADEAKFFYANSVEVAWAPFDVSVKFMRMGTDPQGSATAGATPVPRERAAVLLDHQLVSMSPGLAKALLMSLYGAVRQYESSFQTRIPLPKEFAEQFKKDFPDWEQTNGLQ